MLLRLDLPDRPTRDDLRRLSRATGTPLPELVVLDEDPFLAGTEMDWEKARWYADLYERFDLSGLHLRDANYALTRTPASSYAGTDAEWVRLQDGSKLARVLGLVPFGAHPDRRTSLVVPDGRFPAVEPLIELPDLRVPGEPRLDRGEWLVRPMTLQPVRVVMLCEKQGQFLDPIADICRELAVGLRQTQGWGPRTLGEQLVIETIEDGRPLVVLWLSDADSSGEGMANASTRYIEFLRSRMECPPIYVARVALTLDQVSEIEAEYGVEIPLAPDVRRDLGRVELNALPFYAPGWLEERVRDELEALTVEIEDSFPVETEADERLAELRDRAQELYDEIADRLEEISAEAQELIEGIEPPSWEPPELELPDLDRDWILAPDRDYVEQLNAYRRHGAAHHDREPLVLAGGRVCAYCGADISHRAVQARYCSASHATMGARERRRGPKPPKPVT